MTDPSELTLLVLKVGFLGLMWAFIFAVVYALRTDLFGQKVRKLPATVDAAAAAPAPAPAAASAPAQSRLPAASTLAGSFRTFWPNRSVRSA